MLIARPTKFAAGITLYGDPLDLSSLHQTIHDLAPENGVIRGQLREYVLSLAYNVRHANQGNRKSIDMREELGPPLIYQGFDAFWPVLLAQLTTLRFAAGQMPTNRKHQATLFQLEYCVESCLLEIDAKIGRDCMDWYQRSHWFSDNFLTEYLSQRTLDYVSFSDSRKTRFRRLPLILNSFSELSSDYQEFEKEMHAIAKEQNCDVTQLHNFEKWPKFKW